MGVLKVAVDRRADGRGSQISFNINDITLRWIVGLAFTVIIGAAGTYMHWINNTVARHEQDIVSIGENLDIVNAKIELELQYHGIKYNGPPYRPLSGLIPNEK